MTEESKKQEENKKEGTASAKTVARTVVVVSGDVKGVLKIVGVLMTNVPRNHLAGYQTSHTSICEK